MSDNIRKDIINTFFDNFGLKSAITMNLKIFNFLDKKFNLCTRRYQPYRKPKDIPIYITVISRYC